MVKTALFFLEPIVRIFGSQFKILMLTLTLYNIEILKITEMSKDYILQYLSVE